MPGTIFLHVIKLKFGKVSGTSIHLWILVKICKGRMTINFALQSLEFTCTTFQNTSFKKTFLWCLKLYLICFSQFFILKVIYTHRHRRTHTFCCLKLIYFCWLFSSGSHICLPVASLPWINSTVQCYFYWKKWLSTIMSQLEQSYDILRCLIHATS